MNNAHLRLSVLPGLENQRIDIPARGQNLVVIVTTSVDSCGDTTPPQQFKTLPIWLYKQKMSTHRNIRQETL